MLKELHIQNIILIENDQISFEKGFNVLTGETGSGKSAIMNSLNLIRGERTDPGMIRYGCEKGVVEAVFDFAALPQIREILEEAGIEHEGCDELLIRREITQAGKSRAFVNNQLAQLALLKKLGGVLFEMVGQHANQKLFSIENHRDILDAFGGLEGEKALFAKSWLEEGRLKDELAALVGCEAQRLREIDLCQMEAEEILAANLKEGEEEELFAEYSTLTHAEELQEKSGAVYQGLSGERQAILPQLNRLLNILGRLVEIDPKFSDDFKILQNALVELQEVSHSCRNYAAGIESDPGRVAEIDERLTLIDRLKKRYGSTIGEILSYHRQLVEKLAKLENRDVEIAQLEKRVGELSDLNNRLANQLTHSRRGVAKVLEEAVTAELRQLNMGKACFYCRCEASARSRHGDDVVEFYLAPNIGEMAMAIRECASGGELARLLLALQTLLAGKERVATLVFDEVDANIGGETASVIGEKLRGIGVKHQLICITHFPQVARVAEHHIRISKEEEGNRTLTRLKVLDSQEAREVELARMVGKRQVVV